MKRIVQLVIGMAVVVGAAVVGWVAASQIKSPAQIAAEAEPPEPSLITVPVELAVISSDIITRGTVRFDQPQSIIAQGVALEGVAPIVTWVIEPGIEFTEGAVLYEISGRPVFALEGELPLFRDLHGYAEGEDVAQFQEALTRMGFDPGEIDGIFGPKTEEAAAEFYAAAGYELIEPSKEDQQFLEAAQDAVDQAKRFHDEAVAAHAAASAADAAVTAAQQRKAAADVAVAAAEAALQAALDSGLAEDDPQVLELQADVDSALQEQGAASNSLDEALMAAAAAHAEAEVFDVAMAQRDLSRARRDLSQAHRDYGRTVPMSEIICFDQLPLRVDSVNVGRGDPAGGEIMQVSGSRLAIDASISINDAEPIRVGDPVIIDLASRGIEITGSVTVKADRPGTHNVGPQNVYLEVVPDEVREELNEANVRITIPVESTGGAVLAVPAAAISATADGSSQVQVEDDDGTTRFVEVIPGLASRGLVQITPVDGDLAEGARVVVGATS